MLLSLYQIHSFQAVQEMKIIVSGRFHALKDRDYQDVKAKENLKEVRSASAGITDWKMAKRAKERANKTGSKLYL